MKPIVAIFTDGGLVGKNPSEKGGTWAWTAVAEDGEHIREVSGYLLPNTSTCPGGSRINSYAVSNNDTEFWAALRALESMAAGWSGFLATDSQVTIERLSVCRDNIVPVAFRVDWYNRAHAAFSRLGTVRIMHLAGHPTLSELEVGHRVNANGSTTRVSRHQKWCDLKCRELANKFEDRITHFFEYARMETNQEEREESMEPQNVM
jgi:ribonuclease HI